MPIPLKFFVLVLRPLESQKASLFSLNLKDDPDFLPDILMRKENLLSCGVHVTSQPNLKKCLLQYRGSKY